jgi:ribosomal protein S18 acetylase RimI-like enzyme
MENNSLFTVDASNITAFPPTCFLNPQNEGYLIKKTWLEHRFPEGLTIKVLYLENKKKCNGFIEYIPGEYAWRAVTAKGYLFIHCLWITPNKFKNKGFGSQLVQECIADAEKKGCYGVAVITSEGSFMAGKDLFLNNDFQIVTTAKPTFSLLIKPLKKGPLPAFNDWEQQLRTYSGLHIVYSDQCPWVSRSIPELMSIAKEKNIDLTVT